ncbi:integrase [Oceanobacillus iheyensis HTE831]|uniref:Integrase n=1 Tax=Oceanobacillus iheyensis (strain DSM 14371 / CIP 107618 / JCM 11309 / KCTC 3954 / HTE831) TaxID=221109 RepID=Q8ETV2_OCEIH|nr:site-specific integrase [Oceanobacillus iheyensis]BAC12109.1 integrase [Oceanobacillus iheyensis HTE831]
MANIKKYTKKDGTTAYMFNAYLGKDPLTGKKKRTTRRGFKTKKDANIALSKILVEVDELGIRQNDQLTFQEVFEEWFKQHRREVKPTTVYAMESKFNRRILPVFGPYKMKDITRSHCQKAINGWAKELKTFKDYKIQANQVFRYAMKMDMIKRNPMDYVTLPKLKHEMEYVAELEEKKHYYTREELRTFLEAIQKDDMAYTMLRLLSFTGARKGELYALHWSDVDFHQKSISLKKTLIYTGGEKQLQTSKTKASRRIVSVDDETLAILKKWRSKQIQRYLTLELAAPFQSDDKQPIFTVYNQLKHEMDYCRLAYLNDKLERIYQKNPELPQIKVHEFRHTHASLLFAAGASIKDVQSRLGHTDIQTTMDIYTHVTDEAKEKTAEMFQKYMTF